MALIRLLTVSNLALEWLSLSILLILFFSFRKILKIVWKMGRARVDRVRNNYRNSEILWVRAFLLDVSYGRTKNWAIKLLLMSFHESFCMSFLYAIGFIAEVFMIRIRKRVIACLRRWGIWKQSRIILACRKSIVIS